MNGYSLAHLANATLHSGLKKLVERDNGTTAEMLAYIAEIDLRRLYRPLGYSSMFQYCVQVLGFSEDVAYKRIHSARVARRFPHVFDAVREGRHHISGLGDLSKTLKRLPDHEARALLAAAEKKSRRQIERLVAQHNPKPDVPTTIRPLGARRVPVCVASPSSVATLGTERSTLSGVSVAAAHDVSAAGVLADFVNELAPGQVFDTGMNSPASIASALHLAASDGASSLADAQPSPERYEIRTTVSQDTHDKLRRVQELLSHQIPSGELDLVLGRAFDALIEKLEKQKIGTCNTPRTNPDAPTEGSRHIPNAVKRAVWKRDGGQCTFVNSEGVRCTERRFIEYDHADGFARGGEATVGNVRLLCRPHNQFAAELLYGAGFMDEKRRAAGANPGVG